MYSKVVRTAAVAAVSVLTVFTSLGVLDVVFDIFNRLVHLLLAADVQLDDLHAVRIKFLQRLCPLSTFMLRGLQPFHINNGQDKC